VRPNVFVIGDAAGLPASKAGSVTHFEGEVLCDNVGRFLAGTPLVDGYDGHVNCFIETGFGKALLIDFNYDTEPLPGHFPSRIGLPLLEESRLNHLGKLMLFRRRRRTSPAFPRACGGARLHLSDGSGEERRRSRRRGAPALHGSPGPHRHDNHRLHRRRRAATAAAARERGAPDHQGGTLQRRPARTVPAPRG
jgi:hypothetical protein